jgi:probable phosphoglycerate mutase
MKKIYISRHGQTDWNLVPKVQGITDIPLNETGIQQANSLAETIKNSGIHFDLILHSPLMRAAKTAQIVSDQTGIPLKIEQRLIEQNFGKYEGWVSHRGGKEFHLAKQQMAYSYENGESMLRIAQRVYNLLDELKNIQDDKTYLLITHGGVARIIHTYFFDIDNEEFSSYSIKNCELKEYCF